MNKWPSHIERMRIPIYGGHLAICRTKRDYKNCLAALDDGEELHKSDWGCCYALNSDLGGKIYIAGVFKGGLGSLIHELDHIAFYVLGWAGVPVRHRGGRNEAHAYLLDAMFSMARRQ